MLAVCAIAQERSLDQQRLTVFSVHISSFYAYALASAIGTIRPPGFRQRCTAKRALRAKARWDGRFPPHSPHAATASVFNVLTQSNPEAWRSFY